MPKRHREPISFSLGAAVRARFKADKPPPQFMSRWEGKGSFFRGHIVGVHDDGMFDVRYNDGFFEERVSPVNLEKSYHPVLCKWQSSGHHLIGCNIARRFDTKGTIEAKVVCWCPAGSDGDDSWSALFHVVHADDDEESLPLADIHAGVRLLVGLPRAPVSSAVPSSPPPAAAPSPSLPAAAPGWSASAAGAHEAGPAGMICQTLPVSEGMPAVAEVLARFKLDAYTAAFDEQGYDDLKWLLEMDKESEAELVVQVGFKTGHAAKFCNYLSALRAQHGIVPWR